jgi:hypothetical protein
MIVAALPINTAGFLILNLRKDVNLAPFYMAFEGVSRNSQDKASTG